MSDNFKRVDNPESCCKGCCCAKMPEFWIRQTIRRRENMRENCCADCCVACTCCLPFAVCQDARALRQDFGVPLPGEGYYNRILKPIQNKKASDAYVYNQPPPKAPPGMPSEYMPQPGMPAQQMTAAPVGMIPPLPPPQ